ncbi:transcriptional repressor [Mycoplasmoides alvi]|uniref:transcriptional repressor n=1 Tax=Mycoplasmoides alvi TaxID=78580 RepID=UPI00051AEB26|nr:transcriptional repressor [Mycoplasmoides alvi]
MKNNDILTFYLDEIKKSNLKLTNSRIEIIKCLINHDKWHTIDDIIQHLETTNKKKPNVASVYNVLHSLIKCKVVNAFLNTRNFKPLFNLRHKSHEHVYCFSFDNNKFITLPFDEELNQNIKHYFERNNFKINDFYVIANGMLSENEKKCK